MAVGPWQIVVIVLLVLLVFGASRLSEIGKGLGEGIRQFKKGVGGDEPRAKRRREDEEDEEDDQDEDEEEPPPERLRAKRQEHGEGTRERRHVRPGRAKASRDDDE